jgi:hypothetical protein
MMFDLKGASSELAQARGPGDDLTHLFLADFVMAETEKFTRDVLNVGYPQAKSHQLGADCHQAATHQPSETADICGTSDRGFSARNFVDQGLNLVSGSLAAEEIQDDARRFFSNSIINAGLGSQPTNQFVHNAPPSAGFRAGYFLLNFILIVCERNYKRCPPLDLRFKLNRRASVAAMQERVREIDGISHDLMSRTQIFCKKQ